MQTNLTRKFKSALFGDDKIAFRLSEHDKLFLSDLAKVELIAKSDADAFHYSHQKTKSSSSLRRLENLGLLRSYKLHTPGGVEVVYTFANDRIARIAGGRMPVIGAKRTDYHELVTSKLYFQLSRPVDFRTMSGFKKDDRAFIDKHRLISPDALYTNEAGERVFVEADSGQYTKFQINHKIASWQSLGIKQVWGQPKSSFSRVPNARDVNTFLF